MNPMNRLGLSGIAVVLLLPLVLTGCCEVCAVCIGLCQIGCLFDGHCTGPCNIMCLYTPACLGCIAPYLSQGCTENPDECAATVEQLQTTAIQFCDQYPEECQQAFDSWVESLEEEEIE
jgi:hypothetical protein